MLGLETPSQVSRDPLCGLLYENLVVAEAFKAIADKGRANNLYFFRNSNGLGINLIQDHKGSLDLYETKSGKALLPEYLQNMCKFEKKYPAQYRYVIYSGDDVPSFEGASFHEFHGTYQLFTPKEAPYHLDF